MTALLVFLAGGIGACARYSLDRRVQASHRLRFPLGTLLVNLIGCLILGAVAGAVAHHHWSPHLQAMLGTGFCGGLTTFSTFSVETVQLLHTGLRVRAAGYLTLSCSLGVAAAALGYALV